MPATPSTAVTDSNTPQGRPRLVALLTMALVASVLAVVAPVASSTASAAPGVHPGGGWVDIAPGVHHTCAVSAKGEVKCWGLAGEGQLGYEDIVDRGDTPGEMGDNLPVVDLGTGRTATAIAVGAIHSCALLDDGSVKCWGRNNEGQLGQGNTFNLGDDANEMGDNLAPVELGTDRTAVAIAAGMTHTCALLDDATVKCWGESTSGELGQGGLGTIGDMAGELGDNLPPIDLGTARSAVAVTAGYGYTCVITDAGTVKCWGENGSGQLGLGDTDDRGDAANEMGDSLPVAPLGGGRTATAITAGYLHTCALLDDATVKCWGDATVGQLGNGNNIDIGDNAGEMGDALATVPLGTDRTAVSVDAGYGHTCARLDDRSVKCWGYNANGQLGLGDVVDRGELAGQMGDNLPTVELGSGRFATAITSGHGNTCVALDDNSVKCWGQNDTGQLGLGDVLNRGDMAGEMGDNLPVVELGTAFLVDPAGVDSFQPARLVETRDGETTTDGQQQGIGRRTAGQVTEVQVTGRVGIDTYVEAAIVNIGIVDPADNGFAVGYPCDEPQPASSTVNYRAGQTIANAATIKLSATGTFCVYTHRDADLIVDVTSVIPEGSTVDSITPARFLETRAGETTTDGAQQGIGRRTAGSETTMIVAGRNGVPADAEAATINVAAINPAQNGFIVAYACGTPRPTASMINYQAGQTIAGGATIPLGNGGAICVYTHQDADLAVDVTAYTPAGSIVEPNDPARLVETRSGETTVDGQQQSIGRRNAGQVTEVQVVGRAGVTGAATAGVFNIAAVNPENNGFVAAYDCDGPQPASSSLNFRAGETIANNATIKLSTQGTICVYTHQATDLIVDLTAVVL